MWQIFKLPSRRDVPIVFHILIWLLVAILALYIYNFAFLAPRVNESIIREEIIREKEDFSTTPVSFVEQDERQEVEASAATPVASWAEETQKDVENFATTPGTSVEDTNRTKVVLYWTAFHMVPDYYVGFGTIPFRSCSVSNCVTTSNRSQLSSSDALIFHPHDINFDDMPPTRLDHQRWIWFDHEPPFYCRRLLYPPNMFNWTMTYRLDSDIVDGYGKVVPFRPKMSQVIKTVFTADLERYRSLKQSHSYDAVFDYDSFIKKKTKGVAWVVSHCPTQSQREKYVRELSKYIKVDIYGRCGNLTCERKHSCMERIGREYWFYLSFENSLCTDYVTEKFFKALKVGAVPIVFGIEGHKKLGPPNGYIDAQQFESPAALAAYLHQMMGNYTLYMEYLRWNDHFLPTDNAGWCELCKKLNDPGLATKKMVYHDMDMWWFDKKLCYKPTW